ncbi:DUF4747 family protein [Shewanella algae]|uniref:DUF4747 family protein n=1 Tax=Shewanella algae TaxID=38313 RepID=UPI001AAFCC5B|nr:DUF4747 family protein [Shewanella algae]MBO2635273.1 DUF4747 family protein [Shewanella algae]
MTRKRTVSYTAFNIRTHPHSPQTYVGLFDRLFDLKRQINLRGDTYCILTEIAPLQDNPLNGISGEIAKFTKIEVGKWFNIEKLRAAEEDETKKIKIPEDLRPNFTSFNFVFYPKDHYLVIEHKDKFGQISPKMLEIYFRKLFDTEAIVEEFNTIELTLVPRTDQLESVLSLKQISTLEIVLRRPNTDGLENLEEEVLKRLNQQNVEEEIIILKAQKGSSVEADDRTIALGHIAQLNGEVKTIGHDENGKRAEKSTRQHPFVETGAYVPGEITAKDFLAVMATTIVKKIKRMARVGT